MGRGVDVGVAEGGTGVGVGVAVSGADVTVGPAWVPLHPTITNIVSVTADIHRKIRRTLIVLPLSSLKVIALNSN